LVIEICLFNGPIFIHTVATNSMQMIHLMTRNIPRNWFMAD